MRSAPHKGLSRAIVAISSRTSELRRGRPAGPASERNRRTAIVRAARRPIRTASGTIAHSSRISVWGTDIRLATDRRIG